MSDPASWGRPAASSPRTSRPTRKCVGARRRTTRSRRSQDSCPSLAFLGITSSSSPASGARRIPVLLNTYGMHSIHGRAPPSRPGSSRAGSVGMGRHRHGDAVDRRQPPDPRAPAQRQPQDPAVQQSDLWTHQRPILTHVRAGQGNQVDTVWLAGQPVQPRLAGSRCRGHVRCPHAGLGPQAPDVCASGGGTP
jgi:hypothetical protein